MKNYEEVLAEACRIDYDENSGRLFLVFEVIHPAFKQKIKTDWTKDLEFRLIDKHLVNND